jgi:hypothetical protein
MLAPSSHSGTQFTCFTGTKVQMLTHARPRTPLMYSVYLLYWYKSTDTGTKVQILTHARPRATLRSLIMLATIR